jgi:hypothetical protein
MMRDRDSVRSGGPGRDAGITIPALGVMNRASHSRA